MILLRLVGSNPSAAQHPHAAVRRWIPVVLHAAYGERAQAAREGRVGACDSGSDDGRRHLQQRSVARRCWWAAQQQIKRDHLAAWRQGRGAGRLQPQRVRAGLLHGPLQFAECRGSCKQQLVTSKQAQERCSAGEGAAQGCWRCGARLLVEWMCRRFEMTPKCCDRSRRRPMRRQSQHAHLFCPSTPRALKRLGRSIRQSTARTCSTWT